LQRRKMTFPSSAERKLAISRPSRSFGGHFCRDQDTSSSLLARCFYGVHGGLLAPNGTAQARPSQGPGPGPAEDRRGESPRNTLQRRFFFLKVRARFGGRGRAVPSIAVRSQRWKPRSEAIAMGMRMPAFCGPMNGGWLRRSTFLTVDGQGAYLAGLYVVFERPWRRPSEGTLVLMPDDWRVSEFRYLVLTRPCLVLWS